MPRKEPSLQSKSENHKGKSKRLFSPEFDLILKPYLSPVKITIAVSKKVAARAVDRNRIKRIIKEAVRKSGLPKKSAVFILKKNIASTKSNQIEQLIGKLISNND